MNVDSSSFNLLSLCTGYGGLDLAVGFAVRNARTVCYVEIETYAAAVLATRMAEGNLDEAPIWSDLRTFDGSQWRGLVDCVTAGYPCQPFSVAGKRRGENDPRHLWPEVRRIIGETQPGWVFLENVAGHLRLGADRVIADLAVLGYDAAWGVVRASDIGAPHQRARWFCLAHSVRGSRSAEQKQQYGECPAIAGGSDAELADALQPNLQHAPTSRESHAGKSITRTGGEMVHAECAERGPGMWAAGIGELADRLSAGLEERRGERRDDGIELASAERDRLPLFPPGPADLDAWRQVLEIDPSLEPAVYGISDGDSARMDRLRLCGNGVVPLQGAYAFCTLFDVLRGRKAKDE